MQDKNGAGTVKKGEEHAEHYVDQVFGEIVPSKHGSLHVHIKEPLETAGSKTLKNILLLVNFEFFLSLVGHSGPLGGHWRKFIHLNPSKISFHIISYSMPI